MSSLLSIHCAMNGGWRVPTDRQPSLSASIKPYWRRCGKHTQKGSPRCPQLICRPQSTGRGRRREGPSWSRAHHDFISGPRGSLKGTAKKLITQHKQPITFHLIICWPNISARLNFGVVVSFVCFFLLTSKELYIVIIKKKLNKKNNIRFDFFIVVRVLRSDEITKTKMTFARYWRFAGAFSPAAKTGEGCG